MSPSYLQAGSNDDDNANNQEGNDTKCQDSIFLNDRVGESKDNDLEILDARIIKKNLLRNRSSRATFVSNSFLDKENSSAAVIRKQRFSFASFYPLSQSDIDKLQHLCGREFSSNAINEILQSLSIKLPNHSFPHKAAFIKYMGKALAYEMRDAVKISNESFKIKSNVTSEEIITQARQEFLNKIDYYGSGGNAMDNAWFDKLKAEVDSNAKKLTLKAPTKFIKDWIESNYTHLIDKLCNLHSYSLEGVFAV